MTYKKVTVQNWVGEWIPAWKWLSKPYFLYQNKSNNDNKF